MRFVNWLYKVATGRTLGKKQELKLRSEKAEAQQTRADDTVKRSCVAREVAQEQHDEAILERDKVIKERKVRVPSSLSIKTI